MFSPQSLSSATEHDTMVLFYFIYVIPSLVAFWLDGITRLYQYGTCTSVRAVIALCHSDLSYCFSLHSM